MSTLTMLRLAKRLKSAREQAGFSLSDVEETKIMSRRTLSKLEKAESVPAWPRVTELARLYRISEPEVWDIKEMTMNALTRGVVENGVLPGFGLLLELEAEATHLDIVEEAVIPGPLQAPEYTQRLLERSPAIGEDDYDKIKAVRGARAAAITGTIRVVVPSYVWGDGTNCAVPNSMNLTVRTSDNLTVGPYQIMAFNDYPTVVYTETLAGATYHEEPDIVSKYQTVFEHVWQESEPV